MHLCHLKKKKEYKTKEIIHHASTTTEHYEMYTIQKCSGGMTDFVHKSKKKVETNLLKQG